MLALAHRQPDRCPIDLGSCGQTGMNVSTVYRLREALGLDRHRIKVTEPFQMLGEIEDDLLKAVHSDVIGLWNRGNMMGFSQEKWKPFDLDDGTPALIGSGLEYDMNEKGDRLVYAMGDRNAGYAFVMPKGGSFFDNLDHFDKAFDWDLDEDELTPEEDFSDDFKVVTDEDARYWERESKALYEGTDYAVMGVLGGGGLGDAAWIPGPTVKHPRGIRTIPDWLMAQVMYPDYVRRVFAMQTEVMLKNLEIYREAVGERIQVIWVSGIDFATQNGLFFSRDIFRSIYMPFYKKINDWIHENTGWKIFYHSCGCINDLLDDFVEIGVDCLNPVQFSAMENRGMTPKKLKQQYGDRLVFWGGGVDTQKVLPFGTPEEVRAQVRERVGILGEGGGYVFNPIHNVVKDVPAENLIAMYETVLGDKITG